MSLRHSAVLTLLVTLSAALTEGRQQLKARAATGLVEDIEQASRLESVLQAYSHALAEWRHGQDNDTEHYDIRRTKHLRLAELYPAYADCMAARGFVMPGQSTEGKPEMKIYPLNESIAPCLLREGNARVLQLK
jgi:hypothetical protein